MKRIATLVLLVIFLSVPSHAHADIAPPAQPPGSSVAPGNEVTQVRMQAETVRIDVQPTAKEPSLGQAHVTADFTMRNLGQADESMAVRFPAGGFNGWGDVNPIRDLRVRVAGKSVPTRNITGDDPIYQGQQVPWAQFDVTFPAGQDVPIQVQYTLDASGEYPFVWFKYILSTGAAWKDSIGSADIVVSLPYAPNNQNLLLDTSDTSFGTTKGGTIVGNEVRWHFENLEPTTSDNFEVDLVMPSAWEHFLAEQSNVKENPRDGEAWGRLGKVCKEMAFSSRGKGFRGESSTLDPGGEQLYQLSLQAYENAVTLLPKDPLWHAGYADLLAYHAYFQAFSGVNTNGEALHSLREIKTALELAPNDPKVQQIAEQISYSFPDGMQGQGAVYDFPWLTSTPPAPTERAQIADTPAIAPTLTPAPEIGTPGATVPTPAVSPAPNPKSPICGSVILIPLALGAVWFVGARKGQPIH